MTDTTMTCSRCGREMRGQYAYHLTHGWPRCCGITMMSRPDDRAVIGGAVDEAFAPVERVLAAYQRHFGDSA